MSPNRLYDLAYHHTLKLLLLPAALYLCVVRFVRQADIGLLLTGGAVFVAYVLGVMAAHRTLKDDSRRLPMLIVLFFMVSVFVCVALSWPVNIYRAVPLGAIPTAAAEPEAFYYVAVTFSTLGYGDISPKDTTGRLFASYVCLFGVTHAVAFVGLILDRHNSTKSEISTQSD